MKKTYVGIGPRFLLSGKKACEIKMILAGVTTAMLLHGTHAQVQTAGTLFVNVDATEVSPGIQNNITNSGALGGYFEANVGTHVANVGGTGGIVFAGTNYMRLVDAIGGALIPPPLGLVGGNATCSIEVWALNPVVSADECMVSWGARAASRNMAFGYGTGASGGAQHDASTGAARDIRWDSVGSGAPLNNHWHHLVYTYDGATQSLYADGVLVNSRTVSFDTMANAGIALGAQWNSAGDDIGTTPGFATLMLAKVRVHDGTLSPDQVGQNYEFEKLAFISTPAPVFLAAGPVHRYSFDEAANGNASGLMFSDSVGTAHGTVRGGATTVVPKFSGRRLVLPGGFDTTLANYGQPYGDLPNGLISANSANKGGSGEVSIEVWYKNTGGTAWSFSRVFDIGSIGSDHVGQEVTGPGGYPTGNGLDMLFLTAQVGANVNQRRLGWSNADTLPAGTTANTGSVTADAITLGTYDTDRHVVVTWKESTGEIIAYENGLQIASLTAPNSMDALNDVNVWLGRAINSGNSGLAGEYDEVRFYNYVLSPAQVVGNFQVGPETVNTAAQAVLITRQPQSATVNEGWAASFSLIAKGSPAVSYQWSHDGTPIPGATSDILSIEAVSLADAGSYTCTVSNNTGTPNTQASTAVTLTVVPNHMLPSMVLHETKDANAAAAVNQQRNNQTSGIGGEFRTGSEYALVTHLGMYDVFGDGLNSAHPVGIFRASDSNLIAEVTVPAGTEAQLIDGYRYAPLAMPLVLDPNTSYFLMAMVYANDGDMWSETWAPAHWNSAFVGDAGSATRRQRWCVNNSMWPPTLADHRANSAYNNQMYGAPNLAVIPVGAPIVSMHQTSVTQFSGLGVTLAAAMAGEAPMHIQWYKGGTSLTGKTGMLIEFPELTMADAGDYHVVASNALNSSVQSASVTLTVLEEFPVTITQDPVGATVPEGFPVEFSVEASGSPPISYQWRLNGTPIEGATSATYSIAAAPLSLDGSVFSCVASNHANGSPQTATSANATLVVQPNVAPAMQTLFPTVAGARDNLSGSVGGFFRVGVTPALVTHLGFYCLNESLNYPHYVGIWPESGGATPLASVFVSGSGSVLTNNYAWEALTTALLLEANTTYIIATEVFSQSGDVWPDSFTPSPWNAYYVGSNDGTTRGNRYEANVYFPTAPALNNAANAIFGAANLAAIPVGPAVARAVRTSVAEYEGYGASLAALVAGGTPMTVQWYKAPSTMLPGETNTTLHIASLSQGDAGNYFLRATNPQGTDQTENITLVVQTPVAPTITEAPEPAFVYNNQPASFSVVASGTPTLRYEWSFKTSPIPDATNATLTLFNVSIADAGEYTVTVSNDQGSDSASAALTILSPVDGSYPAAVIGLGPIVYYRFSDIAPESTAMNLGSLGFPNDGTFRGTNGPTPGPLPPEFQNFEVDNEALLLDGVSTDVLIPAMNIPTGVGPNFTMTAWIRADGHQTHSGGIIFHRGTGGATGMQVKNNNPEVRHLLGYHWNNLKWDFNSSLIVPTNSTWTFVAVVIEPSRATLYLNDGSGMQTDVNVSEHLPEVPFSGPTYIGLDTTGSRRFKGGIDEPAIFNRSLSPEEINALYKTAVQPPPVFLEISSSDGGVTLTWPNGTLQQADQVEGPYSDMTGVESPHTLTPSDAQKFFRVKVSD